MTSSTTSVTLKKRDPLRSSEHPLCPPQVEHFAVPAQHLWDHARIAGKPTQFAYGHRLLHAIDGAKTHARFEIPLVHPHDNCGPNARGGSLRAPERMPTHLVKRVGAHLPYRAPVG